MTRRSNDPDVEDLNEEGQDDILVFVVQVMRRKRFPWTEPMVKLFDLSYESLQSKDKLKSVTPGDLHLRMITLSPQCYSVHIKNLSVDDVSQRLKRHQARLRAKTRQQQQQR